MWGVPQVGYKKSDEKVSDQRVTNANIPVLAALFSDEPLDEQEDAKALDRLHTSATARVQKRREALMLAAGLTIPQ